MFILKREFHSVDLSTILHIYNVYKVSVYYFLQKANHYLDYKFEA